jgi:hypothetical protein
VARAVTGRQPAVWGDLSQEQRELVWSRFEHVQEAETGFRSGDGRRAGPGEPRPQYDPASTTLTARRLAKVAEIEAMGPDTAARIGFARVSERTLKRLGSACRTQGLLGCVNGAWLRRGGDHPSVSEQVREAVFAVRAETLTRSRVSMRTRERMVHQYVRQRFGDSVVVPSYPTLRRVWGEWFGSGGARQRYQRTAARVSGGGEHVVVHRPGQVVALDTSVLPVKVREDVFGEPVSPYLTLAIDAYTHSLPAFRLTLVSDTSVDVAMLLRDVMTPTRMRPGWGPDMGWRYPQVPAEVVEELAGYPVAGLPFFTPETVTTDHGSVYRNHHLVEVQRVLGVNVLPSRVLRPTDKQAIERAFGAARSLLLEMLPGYTGVDVADRGADPEADAVLTVAQLEELVAAWTIGVWQNRLLAECAPAWDPGGRHSPNTLFAASMGQGGFAAQVPGPELFYQLLPAHHVVVHGRRGVKVRGLWYDGPGLDPYRGAVSARGGRHKGRWVVRRDPRDRRWVFFADPDTGAWHTLPWVGLPADGQVPAFGDARVAELLRGVREAGLSPRTDAELLPLLLDLIAQAAPEGVWPCAPAGVCGPTGKARRADRAREVTQGHAASADRPAGFDHLGVEAVDGAGGVDGRAGTQGCLDPHRQARDAVDGQRRRRRERAMAGRAITLPGRLGQAVGNGLLVDASDPMAGATPADGADATVGDGDELDSDRVDGAERGRPR